MCPAALRGPTMIAKSEAEIISAVNLVKERRKAILDATVLHTIAQEVSRRYAGKGLRDLINAVLDQESTMIRDNHRGVEGITAAYRLALRSLFGQRGTRAKAIRKRYAGSLHR